MKISKAFPPNYKYIKAKFNPPVGTLYTYGDTIYAPGIAFDLPADLIVHEETHEIQQDGDPEEWWGMYLTDVQFRLDQEVQAYRNQYRYYLKHNNRQQAFLFLDDIAHDLSGPMYGNMISYKTAFQLIKSVLPLNRK